jgi:hypothetical protein
LEGKTGKLGGKSQGRNDRNESAYTFSEKNRKKNQGRSIPTGQGQIQNC